MKERIYTIPVTDAFKFDCECPMCLLEEKLEREYIEYFLGPSLMEPDCRIITNKNGFCKRHIEKLYNCRENMLGLSLILDTHLCEFIKNMNALYENGKNAFDNDSSKPAVKNILDSISKKQTETDKILTKILDELKASENKCAICDKLTYTMDRYVDVILYLWFNEKEFEKSFNQKKGFCLKHFRLLLEGGFKYLSPNKRALFSDNLISIQLDNMLRIQEEVNWFTKKFDYRYNDAPWKNSKDALLRSIQKIVGFCDFK